MLGDQGDRPRVGSLTRTGSSAKSASSAGPTVRVRSGPSLPAQVHTIGKWSKTERRLCRFHRFRRSPRPGRSIDSLVEDLKGQSSTPDSALLHRLTSLAVVVSRRSGLALFGTSRCLGLRAVWDFAPFGTWRRFGSRAFSKVVAVYPPTRKLIPLNRYGDCGSTLNNTVAIGPVLA
jgi:hypothetical protein